jgi:Phage integrase family
MPSQPSEVFGHESGATIVYRGSRSWFNFGGNTDERLLGSTPYWPMDINPPISGWSFPLLGNRKLLCWEESCLTCGTAWQGLELVFTEADGSPLDHDRMRRAFGRLLRQLEIEHHRPYDLRHTMATLMLANGEHPKVVQERLGHSTVGLTLDTYSSVLPGIHIEAAERLASRFARSGSAPNPGDSLHDPLHEAGSQTPGGDGK